MARSSPNFAAGRCKKRKRAATIQPPRMRRAMSPGGPTAKACRCCCANLPAAAIEPRKDRVLLLAPPFAMAGAQTIVSTEHRISNVRYSKDGRYATMTFSKRAGSGNRDDLMAFDLTASPAAPFVLKANIDTSDPLKLPGDPMITVSGNGNPSLIVSGDGASLYLQGDGYKASFAPQPFVDKVTIRTGATTRVFEGAADTYDNPLVALDADLSRVIVSRESKTTVPDSYLWTASTKRFENLTSNKDPWPEITAAKRVDFEFTRQDGVKVRGRITLPTNYQPGTRVPAVFWDYPREFEDGNAYTRGAIRARNVNSYSPLIFLRWSDIWVTQGYALVYVDIPIVGKEGRFNDNFRPHLVDTIYSAIRTLDEMGYIDVNRLGHGGHSYGAFTTGNLLRAYAVLQGRHRRRRRLQPHADADDLPGRAPQLLGRAEHLHGNLAVLLRRSDPGAAADVSRCAGQQLRHLPHSVRAHDAGADRFGQTGGVVHLSLRIARAARHRELPRPVGTLAGVVRQVRQERAAGTHDDGAAVRHRFRS